MAKKKDIKAAKAKILEEVADSASAGVPFGHFQLFYESIERVTDRRLNLNRTNASLAALIAAGMGVIAAWAFDKAEVRDVALALIFLLGILATLFCRWWWRQIEDYKALNGSKFDVLAQMAKNIVLTGEETRRCAFDPFYWEWKLAEANKDLEGWNGSLVLGSSWSELIVPKAFLAFFLLVSLWALLMLSPELGAYFKSR